MPESLRTVDRALDILLCFTQEKSVLSLTEIVNPEKLANTYRRRLPNPNTNTCDK